LIVSAQMQSENKIYGMWKIYNCKTFFSFLSAFCLVEHSVLRHTWRVRSFSRAQLKTYLHIAYISNPTLLLLLLLLLMTLCRVFTITYLKQTIYLVYVVLQLFCIYNIYCMVLRTLKSVLYFYVSTFRSMCIVPSMALLCRS